MKFGLNRAGSSNRARFPAKTYVRALLVSLFGLAVAPIAEAKVPAKKAAPAAKKGRTAGRQRVAPKPRRHAPAPAQGPPNTAAARYGALSASECLSELGRRGIPFEPEARAPGVKIPVRLRGPVGGVLYRTDEPDAARSNSPWEVFDCRLVLSLSDFGQILARYEVVEARIFSAWRPPPKSWNGNVGRRHQGGLAVDVRTFRKANGEELVVLSHFEGKLGAQVCDTGREPSHSEGKELLAIACGAADAHLFNSILTPNYDAPHRNHFHLELTPDVGWFMLR